MPTPSGRLTQRDIARLARVSQTTVSLVLNDRHVPGVRISDETRARVMRVIRETGYIADPVARRMVSRNNQILGVFTYERVFPRTSADFFHPFLVGIEEKAESLGCDLLLFTSASGENGRRIFGENNRIRLADGCLLLGREVPAEELRRLLAEGFPFVSVGRRDDAGGPVPYVGADYAAATAALTRRAFDVGHRSVEYVAGGIEAESAIDRLRGYTEAGGSPDVTQMRGHADGPFLDALLQRGVTAVIVEDFAVAISLSKLAEERGLRVPGDLSIITLGDPIGVEPDREYTGFKIPREEMGRQAAELLVNILTGDDVAPQRLLPCELVDGTTLGSPSGTTAKGT